MSWRHVLQEAAHSRLEPLPLEMPLEMPGRREWNVESVALAASHGHGVGGTQTTACLNIGSKLEAVS